MEVVDVSTHLSFTKKNYIFLGKYHKYYLFLLLFITFINNSSNSGSYLKSITFIEREILKSYDNFIIIIIIITIIFINNDIYI